MGKPLPEPKAGDACPNCGGEFHPARVPTAEQYKAATDRENPAVLPPDMDTAPPLQREELGALHRCESCGYVTRIKSDGSATDDEADGAAAGAGSGAKRGGKRSGAK